MRSTPDDILTALELVASRVPDRHVSPDPAMVVAWHESLSRFDHAAVLRAAREWGGLRFPAAAEFVAEVQAAARAIAVEEASAHHAGELALRDCPDGCNDGLFHSSEDHGDGGSYFFVRPCERCRPVAHAIWKHRYSAPDHHPERCPDCVAVRRGKDPLPQWLLDARDIAARRGRVEERF